jgi:hypothetical protein
MKLIKTYILVVISTLMAILYSSCTKDQEPYKSPVIRVHGLFINSDSIKNIDTPVPVGDTLKINLGLECYIHDIEYFHINMDREYAKDSILQQDFLEYCDPLYTNTKEGVYYLKPGVQNMLITLSIIPKRAKEDEKAGIPVSLSLKSKCNSGDDYNPFYVNFNYFITNKK